MINSNRLLSNKKSIDRSVIGHHKESISNGTIMNNKLIIINGIFSTSTSVLVDDQKDYSLIYNVSAVEQVMAC